MKTEDCEIGFVTLIEDVIDLTCYLREDLRIIMENDYAFLQQQ